MVLAAALTLRLAGATGEFELHGVITQESLFPSGSTPVVSRPFSVYVRDCQWLIHAERERPGYTPDVQEYGSTNGQVIYRVGVPGLPLGQNTSGGKTPLPLAGATIVSNSVVVSSESGLYLAHLWLMFAARCYLEAHVGQEIAPVYDEAANALHDKGYQQVASWTLSPQPPHLPENICFLNTRGRVTMGKDRRAVYVRSSTHQDYTNALYRVTGFTNVGGLTLPTGFVFTRYGPVREGAEFKLREYSRAVAVVTNASSRCSRASLLPVFPDRIVVADKRLERAEPSIPTVSYAAKSFPTAPEVVKIHQIQQARQEPKTPGQRWGVLAFVLLALMPLAVLGARRLWQRRKQKG